MDYEKEYFELLDLLRRLWVHEHRPPEHRGMCTSEPSCLATQAALAARIAKHTLHAKPGTDREQGNGGD